jgi:hypothetical protein
MMVTEVLPSLQSMTNPKPQLDEELNPYAAPRIENSVDAESPAELLVRDYRGRARAIRSIALLHVVFASFLIPAAINATAEGFDRWNKSIRALKGPYTYPELVSAGHRNHALLAFGIGIVVLIVGGLSIGVAVGLWRFRRWAGRLATGQGFFVVAVGIAVAMYQLINWGDPSGGGWMLPGLVLVVLAGFVRSRRSVVVCSDTYRNARAEVAHTKL